MKRAGFSNKLPDYEVWPTFEGPCVALTAPEDHMIQGAALEFWNDRLSASTSPHKGRGGCSEGVLSWSGSVLEGVARRVDGEQSESEWGQKGIKGMWKERTQ